jgi:hypothetical protein
MYQCTGLPASSSCLRLPNMPHTTHICRVGRWSSTATCLSELLPAQRWLVRYCARWFCRVVVPGGCAQLWAPSCARWSCPVVVCSLAGRANICPACTCNAALLACVRSKPLLPVGTSHRCMTHPAMLQAQLMCCVPSSPQRAGSLQACRWALLRSCNPQDPASPSMYTTC